MTVFFMLIIEYSVTEDYIINYKILYICQIVLKIKMLINRDCYLFGYVPLYVTYLLFIDVKS